MTTIAVHWLPVSPVPWVSSMRKKSSMNRPAPYQAPKNSVRNPS
jgi:hypothetical protein